MPADGKKVKFEEEKALVIPAPPRRKRRAGLSDRGDGFGDEEKAKAAAEQYDKATIDDLLQDEEFMADLTSRLGGDVQPVRDERAKAAEAPPDEAMAKDP